MTLDCSQDVVYDLENLLETDEGYDVIIYAGENENETEIHAHSLILRTRSQYFRTAFFEETWIMARDGKYIFKKPNVKPNFIKIILRFFYCGKVDLTKLLEPDIMDLLIVVDEFKIQILIRFIQEYLIKNLHEFLRQNRVRILDYFYQNDSVLDLWNYCFNNICEEVEIFFNSNKFFDLKENLLELLLKRDDLSSNEIVIWKNLINWCLAKHPSISSDVEKWNRNEIAIMEKTIHNFIPLIRFYEMSSDDFLSKVYPYRNLLPKDLINNVLIFHMDLNVKFSANIKNKQFKFKKCGYDSILIKPRHFAIIASWIEKKDDFYDVRNLPYSFNLIYRSSKHGYTTAAFHEHCDNRGASIVIGKVTNSDQLVGGYNPLSWDSNKSWNFTVDSFIFSSKNRDNLQNTVVSYSFDEHSIYCDPLYGPAFGSDLICSSNGAWRSKERFYHKIDAPLDFEVDDYEVFQVIKRFN
ncbi:hypothetical protein GLOIN_2v1769268 [Rhizophagus irregularis DAOM 181602=DAOM 197198]|uniref:Uncharacterized protein n=2 Tax=Rhizophagus irregularis TaxID=588596 RepID=U9UST3_RHIID|nr:hypothetical protein GLOIN_2v1769268 [Rhizophagus irregularis DAOM 181602=DAOM 197198]EXX57224.1 hypothetical protein RirG_209160 [Rhizophagus irregularis DAOM 197198w]POG76248.1 hypothetical protein GLOIN_2v1769268 [Rhizophagus irregularis DAOM 181602=DAOM 197198]|eukprot:XP_025183114.1 hypothetical protein GLOIN_2v1769268 [Rhizophagus irregularis DAOM 181602=DAOM 197198]